MRFLQKFTILLIVGAGCAGGHRGRVDTMEPSASTEVPRHVIVEIRRQTEQVFARSVQFKPREGTARGRAWVLAPLIVNELSNGAGSVQIGRIAALSESALQHSKTSDPPRPTVFYSQSTVSVGGMDLAQMTYLWWYQPRKGDDAATQPVGMGVRVVLGPDDMPIVWEALSTVRGPRVLFVSRSLEDAAGLQYGEPLPECRFSVERPSKDGFDVVVARVIDDGPVAMGPYVYVAAPPSEGITTVLCRCMPSQMESVEVSPYYDLQPIESLGFDDRSGPKNPIRSMTASPSELRSMLRSLWRRSEEPLDGLLRWPKI